MRASRVRLVDDPHWAGGWRFDIYFTAQQADLGDFRDGQSLSRECVVALLVDLGHAIGACTLRRALGAAISPRFRAEAIHHLLAHPLLFVMGGARWATWLHDETARQAWPQGGRG